MSNTKLFRQEALKHQFKSQDYGEALVQMPSSIEKSLGLLIVVILISLFVAMVIPVSVSHVFDGKASVANYIPVVSNHPVVIEQHLQAELSQITRTQKVVQVRIPNRGDEDPETVMIKSPTNGVYFPLVSPGQTLSPLTPIARVLIQNQSHHYLLDITTDSQLVVGSQVKVSSGSQVAQGVLLDVKKSSFQSASSEGSRAILEPSSKRNKSLLVKLNPPYSLAMFAPNQPILLEIQSKQSNMLRLLR